MGQFRTPFLESMNTFFGMVKAIYSQYDLHQSPQLIFNLDETGLSTDERASQCFFKRGTKDAHIRNPTGRKAMYTVLFCGSADGNMLPPFVVYKAKHLYDTCCSRGPAGASYGCTASGWMENKTFEDWFTSVFIM